MSIRACIVGAALALLAALPAAASSFQILYEVPPFDRSGRSPLSLVQGKDGSFYGVMRNTIINDPGAIFRLAPPAAGQAQWQFSVLHEFSGVATATEPGGYLQPNLLVDGSGNIYGGTFAGINAGSTNLSTSLFRLSPPASAGQPWAISVSYPMTPNTSKISGLQPSYRDFGGALYGIATFGNLLSSLKPFVLSPTLHLTLLPVNDPGSAIARCGRSPNLIRGQDGSFYGTTDRTVYRLTRPAPGQTEWTFRDIYVDPTIELCYPIIADRSLNIYSYDGNGNVYELFPPASGQGAWRKSILYDFRLRPALHFC